MRYFSYHLKKHVKNLSSLHPYSTYVIEGYTCMLPISSRHCGALYTLDLRMYKMVIRVVFRYYGLAQVCCTRVIPGNLADFVTTQSFTRVTLKQPWTKGADAITTKNNVKHLVIWYMCLQEVSHHGIWRYFNARIIFPIAIYLLKSACIAVPASHFFQIICYFKALHIFSRWIIFLFWYSFMANATRQMSYLRSP